ncbi:MAG: hypothetical protein U0694_10260 [Anaerolineae bacterium]
MMSIDCRWYDKDKKAIIATYKRGWKWADYLQAKAMADAMLNSVSWRVQFLADLRGASVLPSDSALSYFTSVFSTAPSNLGIIVTVGASRVVRVLFQAVQHLTRNPAARNLQYVETMEEAHAMMEEYSGQKLVLVDPAEAPC